MEPPAPITEDDDTGEAEEEAEIISLDQVPTTGAAVRSSRMMSEDDDESEALRAAAAAAAAASLLRLRKQSLLPLSQ